MSIITFASSAQEIQALCPADQAIAPTLTASGGTDLGAALSLLNATVAEDRVRLGDLLPPQIIILTDGHAGSELLYRELRKLQTLRGHIIGVGVGGQVDVRLLRAIASNVVVVPLLDWKSIGDVFAWLGDVVRIAATSDGLRIFPQPPKAALHIAGMADASGRRWSDDRELTHEDLERFHHEEDVRRQMEDIHQAKALAAAQQRDESRREEMERRAALIRRMVHEADTVRELDSGASPPDSTLPMTSMFLRRIADHMAQELADLPAESRVQGVHDLTQECALHVMAIRHRRDSLLSVYGEFRDSLLGLIAEGLGHGYLGAICGDDLRDLQQRLVSGHPGDSDAAFVLLENISTRLFDIVYPFTETRPEEHVSRLRDALALTISESPLSEQAIRDLPRGARYGWIEYRRVALEALNLAASIVVDRGRLDAARRLIDLAERSLSSTDVLMPQIVAIRAALESLGDVAALRDDVLCTVFAPARGFVGERVLVQVLLHVQADERRVRRAAKAADPETRKRGAQQLTVPIKRRALVTVRLEADSLEVEDPCRVVEWMGQPQNIQFTLVVPHNAASGKCHIRATVFVAGVPVGDIKFCISVISSTRETERDVACATAAAACRFRSAFVSYATPDRKAAYERTRILNQLGIEVFLEVLSLDPGDRWKQALYRHIDECDLFLLVWSPAAKDSKWVRKESLRALRRQRNAPEGIPKFCPVVLPPPPPPVPWRELAHIHFNDKGNYLVL